MDFDNMGDDNMVAKSPSQGGWSYLKMNIPAVCISVVNFCIGFALIINAKKFLGNQFLFAEEYLAIEAPHYEFAMDWIAILFGAVILVVSTIIVGKALLGKQKHATKISVILLTATIVVSGIWVWSTTSFAKYLEDNNFYSSQKVDNPNS